MTKRDNVCSPTGQPMQIYDKTSFYTIALVGGLQMATALLSARLSIHSLPKGIQKSKRHWYWISCIALALLLFGFTVGIGFMNDHAQHKFQKQAEDANSSLQRLSNSYVSTASQLELVNFLLSGDRPLSKSEKLATAARSKAIYLSLPAEIRAAVPPPTPNKPLSASADSTSVDLTPVAGNVLQSTPSSTEQTLQRLRHMVETLSTLDQVTHQQNLQEQRELAKISYSQKIFDENSQAHMIFWKQIEINDRLRARKILDYEPEILMVWRAAESYLKRTDTEIKADQTMLSKALDFAVDAPATPEVARNRMMTEDYYRLQPLIKVLQDQAYGLSKVNEH